VALSPSQLSIGLIDVEIDVDSGAISRGVVRGDFPVGVGVGVGVDVGVGVEVEVDAGVLGSVGAVGASSIC
jgi:hypothetical protein